MTHLVFSRDRALQLYAFLHSYKRFVSPLNLMRVLYRATTLEHQTAYEEVFKECVWAVPCCQSPSFKEDVLRLLPATGFVTFFVDDQIFIRPWQIRECDGLSLRLAPHLTKCYTNGTAQNVPPLFQSGDLFAWQWSSGEGDWAYPLSLDGHIFNLEEIRPMIEFSWFNSPNTLEAALQHFVPRFINRFGKCYEKAVVVNVPWSRVQQDCDNRFAGLNADNLLGYWQDGQRIDYEYLYDVLNESVHQEFPLLTVAR